jgi:hypothetical protein
MGKPVVKIEDASSYYGSLQLARIIKNYWLERGRKCEPNIRAMRAPESEDQKVAGMIWGLTSGPYSGGMPPQIPGVKTLKRGW